MINITEDYVSFETAKLLKEKGFQAKCTACYRSDPSHTFELVSGRINYCSPRFNKYKMIPPYNAPTLQMALKWLREVHKLFVFVSTWLMLEDGIQYYFEIREIKTRDFETLYDYSSKELNSVEKACEAAIKYCLENLI